MPRPRKVPKMYSGSSGITNVTTTLSTTSLSSCSTLYRLSDFTAVMARPTTKASSSEDIIASGGGISTVK